MPNPDVIAELTQTFSPDNAAKLVASLKRDECIWDALMDERVFKVMQGYAAGRNQLWTPANIGLAACKATIQAENLSAQPLIGIENSLRISAAKSFEHAVKSGLIPANLENATLIALALRERRRITSDWDELEKDLELQARVNERAHWLVWRTSLAVLIGIIPDPENCLEQLLIKGGTQLELQWVTHAILCNPFSQEQELTLFSRMFGKITSERQVAWLKILEIYDRSDLAGKLAGKLLESQPRTILQKSLAKGIPGEGTSKEAFEPLAQLEQSAELYRVNGQYSNSLEIYRHIEETLRYWLAGLRVTIADAESQANQGNSPIPFLAEQLKDEPERARFLGEALLALGDPIDQQSLDGVEDENPILKLNHAQMAAKAGDIHLAQILGKEGLQAIVAERGNQMTVLAPKFAHRWQPQQVVQTLLNLGLYPEALQSALLFLETRATDITLNSLAGDILVRMGNPVDASRFYEVAASQDYRNPEAFANLAAVYRQAGSHEKAHIAQKQKIALLSDGSVEDMILLSEDAYQLGNSEEIIRNCQVVLQSEPNHARANALLGKAFNLQGQTSEGIRFLQIATTLDETDENNWLELAEMLVGSGETQQVMETLVKAVEEIPNSYALNLKLAQECTSQGYVTESLGYWKKAFESNPDSLLAAQSYGATLALLGKMKDAEAVFNSGLGEHPEDAGLSFQLGSIYLEQQKVAAALPYLRLAAEKENANPTYLLVLADALAGDLFSHLEDQDGINTTNLSEIDKTVAKLLEIEPRNFSAHLLNAESGRAKHDFGAAYQIYSELVDLREASLPAYRLRVQAGLGESALATGQVEIALAALQSIAIIIPDRIHLQHLLCEAYIAADLQQEAQRVAHSALKLAPDRVSNILWFVEKTEALGLSDEAVEQLKIATQLAPEDEMIWILLAEKQIQIEDINGAKTTLHTVAQTGNLGYAALRKIALLYLQLAEISLALHCLEQAVVVNPNPNGDQWLELAMLYYRLDKPGEALDLLQQASQALEQDYGLLVFQADLLASLDRPQAALACLEHALQLANLNPQEQSIAKTEKPGEGLIDASWFIAIRSIAGMHCRFTVLLRQLGNYPLAFQHAQQALQLQPDDLFTLYLAADLSASMLDFEDAEELLINGLAKVISQLDGTPKERLLHTDCISLLGEVQLELEKPEDAQQSLVYGLSLDPENSRLIALKARLEGLSGDFAVAGITAIKILVPTEKSQKSFGLNTTQELKRTSILWLAECNLALRNWNQALKLFETYDSENPQEARGKIALARAIVITAECRKDLTDLKAVRLLENASNFGEEMRSNFEQAITAAAGFSTSVAVNRWKARGLAIFNIEPHSVRLLAGIAQTAGDVAALIRLLRLLNLQSSGFQQVNRFQQSAEVLMQGAFCATTEDPIKALDTARNALAIRPKDGIYQMACARVAELCDEPVLALECAETALSLMPDEPEWHATAARFALAAGDIDRSIVHWEKACSICPTCVNQLELAFAYLRAELFGKALAQLESLHEANPEDMDIELWLAKAYYQCGKLDLAYATVQSVLEQQPGNISAHLLCGNILYHDGKFIKALESARTAQEIEPQNDESNILLTRVLRKMGMEAEALSILQMAAEKCPTSLPIQFEHAEITYQQKGASEAFDVIQKLAADFPESGEALALLAQAQVEQKDLVGAEVSAFRALRLLPNNPELNLLMGKLQRKAGQLDQAIHFLSEAVRLQPASLEGNLELGGVFQQRREDILALRAYQQAIRMTPRDYRAYFQAGVILKDDKDYVAAESMLRKAAELAPEDTSIRKQLGAVITLNLVHNSLEDNSRL